MPKIMRASEVKVPKTFRLKQETLDTIEMLQDREGLRKGEVIDLAIQLLLKKQH